MTASQSAQASLGKEARMNLFGTETRVRLLTLVGLAFYWPMLTGCKNCIKAYSLTDYDATVYALVYFAAIALLGAFIRFFCKGLDRWIFTHGREILALGAAASLVLLPGVFAPAVPTLGVLLVAPSLFLCALAFCLCTIGWGVVTLSSTYAPHRKTFLIDIAVTFALGYAAPTTLLDFMPTLDASLIPETLRALAPLATCLCLTLVLRDAVPIVGNSAQTRGTLPHKAAAPLLAIAVFVLVCSTIIGIFSRTASMSFPYDAYEQRHIFLLVFSVLFIACMYIATRRPHLRAMIWGAMLLLVVTGMFLPIVYGESFLTSGIDILVVGRLLIWLLYWALLVEVARREHHSMSTLMGGFFLAVRGTSCIMTDLLHYALPVELVSAIGSSPVMICVELALLGCSFGIIGFTAESASSYENGAAAASTHMAADTCRKQTCQALSSAFHLTDSETTILEYLSMGYTMQRIAELQYISQNTVRSHVKGLYRKLDCHSKQEVIELINKGMKERV